MSEIDERMRMLAGTPVLLVACDFDGTLAPIVDRPQDAAADPAAWRTLVDFGELRGTHAAVISGRGLADLGERIGLEAKHVELAGSHGLETLSRPLVLTADQAALLQDLIDMLRREGQHLEGAIVEIKPASTTFHYRQADEAAAELAVARIVQRAEETSGVRVLRGHKVVELCVLEPGKGAALTRMREALGATGVLFIGDDVTDESAFEVLRPTDLGVKIGPGPTAARCRINEQVQVAELLGRLLEMRREWAATQT